MQYCEITPRNNRGIVHLKTVVYLKKYNLQFDRDSKVLYCIDCLSGESIQICPLYEYKSVEDSKHCSRNCYEFKVALKISGDNLINHKEDTLSNSKDFSEKSCNLDISEHKELIKLLYLDNKGFDILKGFTKGLNEVKAVKISNSSKIIWTKFQIDCRDFVILEDSLLSIDIRSCEGIYCLIFRIGIKIDKKLNYLDLKVASISSLSDSDSLKSGKNLVVKCKNCGTELELLSEFNLYSLPSDLYLNSIGSIYCEECQDNLASAKSDSIEDKLKLSHKHNILYLSDETVTVNHSLGSKHTHTASNTDYNTNYNTHCNTNCNNISFKFGDCLENCLEDSVDEEICCSNCQQIVGSKTSSSVTYLKNRVAGIFEGIDLFWRHSECIEFIEKIQFVYRINLKYSCGFESIYIIKVTKEPDTFIFNSNNPVLTSRILYKIEKEDLEEQGKEDCNNSSKEYKKEQKRDKENKKKDKVVEEIDSRLFEHIKYLILLFSHDQDNSDWIASLLPQI